MKIKWLSTVKQFGEDEIVVEQMEMRPDGSAARHGAVPDAQGRLAGPRRRAAADVEFLKKVPDLRVRRRTSSKVDRDADAERRHLRRRRHDRRRAVTIGVGHGKKAARNIDAWLRGGVYEKPPQHPPVPTSCST